MNTAFYCVVNERYFLGAVGLINSLRLVGHMDRANLVYRALPRHEGTKQALAVSEASPSFPFGSDAAPLAPKFPSDRARLAAAAPEPRHGFE